MSIEQLWTSCTFPTSPYACYTCSLETWTAMDIHHPQCPCRICRTVQWNPTLTQVQPQSHCPSYPTVPCRIGGTVRGNPLSHWHVTMWSDRATNRALHCRIKYSGV